MYQKLYIIILHNLGQYKERVGTEGQGLWG